MHSPFWGPTAPSIGMACNIYNDVHAVAGLLETASQFFDELVFVHAGPQGAYSTDGTIELIEKWKAKIIFASIDEGFGIIRTHAVRSCKTEWVMILDADERFWPTAPIVFPHGDAQPFHMQHYHDAYNQGAMLKRIIQYPDIDVVKTIRRHWDDFSWTKPRQNWHKIPDIQMRIMRNIPEIGFKAEVRMHEQLRDSRTGGEPRSYPATPDRGPFHDHYHCFFKLMEPEQRAHDIQIFDAIYKGETPSKDYDKDKFVNLDYLRIHHT